MKVKIRCDHCARLIAVDEAFVGGVCRCPFCKALVSIDGEESGGRAGSRPEAPGLESARPEAPVSRDVAADLARRAAAQKSVPTASPVKMVNVVGIVLAVALVAIVIVGLVIAVRMGVFRGSSSPEPTTQTSRVESPAPAATTVPATGPAAEPQPRGPATVAGTIEIEPPVAYCLELGPGRIGQRSGVVALATESVRTLGPARTFAMAACSGGAVQWRDGRKFTGGGLRAATGLEGFFSGLGASGAAPVAEAFEQALKISPRTVVVLAWSKLQAAPVAARAKNAGVKVVVVCVAGDDAGAAALEAFAHDCGGSFQRMTRDQLEAFGEAVEKARAGQVDRK
ncbi:MAG: hypothetical protein NTV86_07480 [Planctomycetota bacterium]|nr:hypothetical protein [Planctomycetota bacterium]